MNTMDRVIVLIDMDCFYCQVEEKLNPQLKGKPIAVVQYKAWRGGGIIAVNYPARDEGVTRHMRGNDAKKKCPSIELVRVPEVRGKADLTRYRDAGKDVADVLSTFTPLLERASVDEAYLDITDVVSTRIDNNLEYLTSDALQNTFVVGDDTKSFLEMVKTNREFKEDELKLAVGGLITEEIRREVYEKTGYKCSAGIAHNKILAKLVCGLHKPDKQTILPQQAITQLFEKTPINKVKSLGGKFGQSLSDDFQISFMGQLANISMRELLQKYDEKTANWLFNIARGVDTDPVTSKLKSKSIACCKNFPGKSALITTESVTHWLSELAEEVSERLDKDLKENNRKAKQIVVSFTQEINNKDVNSSRTHPLVSYSAQKITQGAFEVVKKFCLRVDGSFQLKFLGLSASHFEDVTKVRTITSFFKTEGANSSNEEETSVAHDDANPEESVYLRRTQELEENIDDLIFYDDACRIQSTDKIIESSNVANICTSSTQRLNHESVGFFDNYFKNEKLPEDIEDNEKEDYEEISKNTDVAAMDIEVDLFEVCSECHKNVPKSEFMSHQDYHFAVKLSKTDTDRPPKRKNISEKKHTIQHTKRKNVKSQDLTKFFKQDNVLSSELIETCEECGRKLKKEEVSSHQDYHMAKKIHLEINSLRFDKKRKNTNQGNRSVLSFFKNLNN